MLLLLLLLLLRMLHNKLHVWKSIMSLNWFVRKLRRYVPLNHFKLEACGFFCRRRYGVFQHFLVFSVFRQTGAREVMASDGRGEWFCTSGESMKTLLALNCFFLSGLGGTDGLFPQAVYLTVVGELKTRVMLFCLHSFLNFSLMNWLPFRPRWKFVGEYACEMMWYGGRWHVTKGSNGGKPSINQSTLCKHGKWLSKLVFRHAVW